jgi:sodium/bile acid cotransporter 7
MLPFLAKRWFLLTLVAGVAVAGFWPGVLGWTRSEWLRPQLVMALALFLSAWTMESRSLYQAIVRPWPSLWATAISYGFLPALAWVSGFYLLTNDEFRIGLMICASVPCTLASAVLWTRMAGGNEATALLTTFITTGISWFATTAWLSGTTGQEVALDIPAMMRDLALILVLPVALGQLGRTVHMFRWVAVQFRQPLSAVSRVLILLIMLRAAVLVSEQLAEKAPRLGVSTILVAGVVCLGNHLVALFGGAWSSRQLGFDRRAQIAVAIAGSQKTLPVSLALLDLYFPAQPLAVVPMLFYHSGQLIADTFIADMWARDQESGHKNQETGGDDSKSGLSNTSTTVE